MKNISANILQGLGRLTYKGDQHESRYPDAGVPPFIFPFPYQHDPTSL